MNAPIKSVQWVTACPDGVRWIERIARHSKPGANGCQVWIASTDRSGYGKFAATIDGRRVRLGAHRAAWLSMVGPIPEGLVIDHLCRNRACVNVSHMEVVTVSVNTLRGDHSNKAGRSGRRGYPGFAHSCGKHAQDDGRLWTRKDGYTVWVCRICARARRSRWLTSKARP